MPKLLRCKHKDCVITARKTLHEYIFKLRKSGMGLCQIARIVGMTPSNISYLSVKFGFPKIPVNPRKSMPFDVLDEEAMDKFFEWYKPRRRTNFETWKKALRLYFGYGYSYGVVAKALGKPITSMQKIIKDLRKEAEKFKEVRI